MTQHKIHALLGAVVLLFSALTGVSASSLELSTKTASHRALFGDSIYTDETCYHKGDDIKVSFTNSYPASDDWVGIYDAHADSHNLGSLILWLWTCGTRSCSGKVSSGTVVFGYDTGYFPLGDGEYIAVLARNGPSPYEAYAVSDPFTVKDGSSCPGATPNPTPYPTRNPSPTPYPTSAPATIETDEERHHKGDDIKVTFYNPQPEDDDWVGIYYADADPDYLGHAIMWLRTCGDQRCRGKVTAGMLVFGAGDPVETGTMAWPLSPGTYVAFLIRNGASPYQAYAASDEFVANPIGQGKKFLLPASRASRPSPLVKAATLPSLLAMVLILRTWPTP